MQSQGAHFPHCYRGMRPFVAVPGLVLLTAASLISQLPRGLVMVANSGENSVAVVDPQHREPWLRSPPAKAVDR